MLSSPFGKLISEIFDLDKPIVNSNLIYLSNLAGKELEFFRQTWAETTTERRRQVISRLVQLGEGNFDLDFDDIFRICLQDADDVVRVQAITGLEEMEDYSLIIPLTRLLKEDSSEEVRAAAAVALGKFAMLAELGKLRPNHTAKVCSALLEAAEDETEFVEVRRRALEAISPLSLPQVKELIEEAYQGSDIKVKASAIYAMGRSCDLIWLPIIIKELSNSEAEIRYEAAAACGELELEEAVPYLVHLLRDEDDKVREAAIKALGEIGGEEARQALSRLLDDPRDYICQEAKAALAELGFWQDPLPFKF